MSKGSWKNNVQEPKDAALRFFNKVKKTNKCWIFIGARNNSNYGKFSYNKKAISAHRFSWIFHNKKIPGGMQVLHKCDNPPCVNPKHLFLGTPLDNARDKVRKGRAKTVAGEKHSRAILTEKDVLDIRRDYISHKKSGPGSRAFLSKKYKLSVAQLYAVAKGKSWKYLNKREELAAEGKE